MPRVEQSFTVRVRAEKSNLWALSIALWLLRRFPPRFDVRTEPE